jgi:hydroxymethylbilane synthase
MRLRLLSRGSALAVLQARLVAKALRERWPDLDVTLHTQSSEGDRDRRVALWDSPDKGLFTADLSQALVNGGADLVVHSWKDLPITSPHGTRVAATLERADPRDVLLLRRDVVEAAPPSLTLLTSSPRRVWQAERALPALLPWRVATLATTAVRGNIPTRLAKLVAGEGHGLIVAKAALDRLLSDADDSTTARAVRAALDECRWMVLPLKEFPTAPAQGAIAVEIAEGDGPIATFVEAIDHAPTHRAVVAEREMLAAAGGGCHEAFGTTIRERPYGRIVSVRGRMPSGEERNGWTLDTTDPAPPPADMSQVWPRRNERDLARREAIDPAPMPPADAALWVARAEALPASLMPRDSRVVWTAGSRTWEKLARRGVWVHGCAEGLGDDETPQLDTLAGRTLTWQRLTHADSGDPDALATYVVTQPLPDDLDRRTHFYWTSGRVFRDAVERFPTIRGGWHASGPGRTARTIRETLGADSHTSVWLDYDQWLQSITR